MITALVTGVAAWGQSTTAPATSGAGQAAALDPELDKILTRLETRDVHDLQAGVVWHQHYILEKAEDDVSKRGEIWYQDADPVAKFLIHFREKIGAGGRRDKWDEKHLFDGCWYVELQSRTKTVMRREIRKPDDPHDPYKVGEGVFPLPFGQKKADILREFEVQRVPPGDGDPPASDRVQLTPREGTDTQRSYKRIDFWISREGKLAGLPIKVRVAKKRPDGKVDSYITVTFSDAELNQGFSRSLFEIETPSGYHEEIERLEPAAAPPGAPPAER